MYNRAFLIAVILLISLSSCSYTDSGIRSDMAEDLSTDKSQYQGEVIFDNRINSADQNTGKNFLQLGFDLLENESLGNIKIGMKSSEIIKVLGNPELKSKDILTGADGKKHQSWSYPKKGIEIDLILEDNYQKSGNIKIYSPCVFMTKRNIGIGSFRDDLIKAYSEEINKSLLTDDNNTIIAGTEFGGLIFTLDGTGKVISIFLGTAAE